MIGHEQKPAIARERRRERLAGHADSRHLLVLPEVEHRYRVVEPVADEKRLAVRTQHRTQRGVAGGERLEHFAAGQFQEANHACRGGTGHEQPLAIRREDQPRRRAWDCETTRERPPQSVEDQHLPGRGAGNVKGFPIRGNGQDGGREVSGRGRGPLCGARG